MSNFFNNKRTLLALVTLAVAAAIVLGAGFAQSFGSKSGHPSKATGSWRSLAAAPDSIAAGRTAVWTGTELIVAGVKLDPQGTFLNSTEVAESYDPATDSWRRLGAPPKTSPLCPRSAAWTGKQMLVWGCNLLAYDPASDTWRRLPDSPTRHGIVAWTGRELIGWGGGCCGDVSYDGSAYDPATNTWRKLAPAPVSGQQSSVGAWTGRELVIFNGHSPEGGTVGGAAYNPKTDTWRRIPSEAKLAPAAPAVLVENEIDVVNMDGTVLAFNPSNNHWRELPKAELGHGPFVVVSTGRLLLVAGPKAAAAYEPHADRWTMLASSPLRQRDGALAAWTGSSMIVSGGVVGTPGGTTSPPRYLRDGAALTPPSIPDPPNLDGSGASR
jgi:hypothetical protein